MKAAKKSRSRTRRRRWQRSVKKYECRFRNRRKHAKICNKYLRNKRERAGEGEAEGEEKKRRKKSQNKIFVMRL